MSTEQGRIKKNSNRQLQTKLNIQYITLLQKKDSDVNLNPFYNYINFILTVTIY